MSVHTSTAAPAAPVPLSAVARARPPRLVVRFALYAGIALVLAAILGGWLARHEATLRAEREVWADARFSADQLGRDDLAHLALRQPVTPTLRDELDELFGRKALTRGVIRVTLFSRDGRVTYSTDHSLIGAVPYDLAQVREALKGKTVHGVSRLRGGFGSNPMVLNSYVPVYWFFDQNSSPNGIIGVYRDYGPVASAIRDDTLIQTGTIVLALLLLYAASFPILRAVTHRLAEDNRLLTAQAEAITASEEQYRLIVETAAEGVCLLDADGLIVFTNRKMADLVGRSDEELIGQPLLSLMDEMSRADADPRLFRSSNGGSRPREFTLRRANGSPVYTSMAVNPIFDREGVYTGALAMVTDISDRKRAEEALHELEDGLAVSPDAASGRRAGAIAQDFNKAVGEIAGYSEFLLASLPAGDPLREEAERLRTALRGAAGMTRQLLAFSRRASLHSGLLDPGDVLRRVEETLPQALGNDVELLVKTSPELGSVEADPAQIEHVLVSLALHARRRMPSGGRLEIEARNVEVDKAFARSHASLLRPGPYVLLAVKDNGRGLDDVTKSRLFHPVAGSEAETEAQLSLATVFGIVKQSHGFIWVDSEPGTGSTFSVYLPRLDPLSAA